MRRALLVAAGAVALVVVPAGAAAAHPLGNFTVNTADRLVITADGVEVAHVVDLAEIPTVQLAQARAGVDADRDGTLSAAELSSYARRQCADAAGGLVLQVDGAGVALSVVAAVGERRPGTAGLATTRVSCTLLAPVRPESGVSFDDPLARERNGWREVSAGSLCGGLRESSAPAQSPSSLLASYPEDLLTSPVDVSSASFSVDAGAPCTAAGSAGDVTDEVAPRGVDRLTSAFTGFLSRPDLSLPFALLSLGAAVLFGVLHALAPGHGKTVMAAYLVGQRGTRRQALQLGGIVTFTHTASVLGLGAVLAAGALAAPELVVPVTEVVSGGLLVLVGIYLLVLASRRLSRAAGHGHAHGEHADHEHHHDDHHHHDHHHHDHPHPHSHPHPATADLGATRTLAPAARGTGFAGRRTATADLGATGTLTHAARGTEFATGHRHTPDHTATPPLTHSHGGRTHTHAPLPDGPLSWKALAGMGIAGGLVPSPSALLVLLGANALGRPLFGVLLVVGYGIGMAVTLTAAGLLLLRARAALDRTGWAGGRAASVVRLLPVGTAAVVVLVGAGLVLRGLDTGRGLL